MIRYESGRHNPCIVFRCRGSVLPKACFVSVPCCIFAVVLHYIFRNFPQTMQVIAAGDAETKVLGGFWFALGFLLVFRAQQGYARWVEGATLFQKLRAEWFNSFSSLIAFCNTDPAKKDAVMKFQHQMVRLFSLLHGCAIYQASQSKTVHLEAIDIHGMERQAIDYLMTSPDRCEICLQWIQSLIIRSEQEGTLKVAPPILSRVFNELGNGIANLALARRITDYPIPFPLAQTMILMLLFHALITPVLCAALVESVSWCGVIAFVVVVAFWSIHFIAIELENPFGDDDNDLPLMEIQSSLNRSLTALMDPRSQQVPSFTLLPRHTTLSTSVKDFQHFAFDHDDIHYGSEEHTKMEEVCVENKLAEPEPACVKTTKTEVVDEQAPVSVESVQIATKSSVPEGKESKDQDLPDVCLDAKEQLVSKAISVDALVALSSATQDNLARLVDRMNVLQERQAVTLESILERALGQAHRTATCTASSVACGRPLELERQFCGYKVAETEPLMAT
eukprot:TRINITY_DN4017_c0_g2_i1.p1 TRINITY_DN4017_c0_g2~~TRINITY_DN4017_c0_g2_i1.p1  ORF type:complete len:507 (+),score=45.68 TRINITY_DN4017_c0_g2_i1:67-1587(+)